MFLGCVFDSNALGCRPREVYFSKMTDGDVDAIVACLRTLPLVKKEAARSRLQKVSLERPTRSALAPRQAIQPSLRFRGA